MQMSTSYIYTGIVIGEHAADHRSRQRRYLAMFFVHSRGEGGHYCCARALPSQQSRHTRRLADTSQRTRAASRIAPSLVPCIMCRSLCANLFDVHSYHYDLNVVFYLCTCINTYKFYNLYGK